MAVRPPLTHKAPRIVPEQPQAAPEPPPAKEKASAYRSPSRVGKRAAVAWLEPEAVKQLNMVAIQRDTQVQHILVEAINQWFASQGLPRFDEA